MNNERRKMIAVAVAHLAEAKADLETARDEEQDYLDNMPESFQEGSKGETAQEAIDLLENVVDGIENAIDEAGGLE